MGGRNQGNDEAPGRTYRGPHRESVSPSRNQGARHQHPWQTNRSAELALKMSANWEVPKSVPFIPPVAVASRKVPRKRKTSVKVLELTRNVSLTRTSTPVPVQAACTVAVPASTQTNSPCSSVQVVSATLAVTEAAVSLRASTVRLTSAPLANPKVSDTKMKLPRRSNWSMNRNLSSNRVPSSRTAWAAVYRKVSVYTAPGWGSPWVGKVLQKASAPGPLALKWKALPAAWAGEAATTSTIRTPRMTNSRRMMFPSPR